MKPLKIAIISALALGAVALTAYILFLTADDHSIVHDNPVEYHTKDELVELYWQNKDLLNSVRDEVLSNKTLIQAMNEEKDGDIGIYLKEDKQYFTEGQWADIVSVFEKFHPYMLMMERKGRPLIFYIDFAELKQDDITKNTYLYWFPNEEEREYHEKPGVFPYGDFTQLDGGWYIAEETRSR